MDKASWNEQWMGYPVGPHYSESSNIDNAHRLKGKLMLIVGELDKSVPPESTYRLVDALVRQAKDFEFVLIPGEDMGTEVATGTVDGRISSGNTCLESSRPTTTRDLSISYPTLRFFNGSNKYP